MWSRQTLADDIRSRISEHQQSLRVHLFAPIAQEKPERRRNKRYRQGFTLYSFAASIPAGRVGEPGNIARAYLYCLTQPFATGSILTVDGETALA